MHRLTLLAVAVLCFSVTAHAQDQPRAPRGWNSSARKAENLNRPTTKPAESVPVKEQKAPLSLLLQGTGTDDLADGELSEEEMLRRISRIYTYQSEILLADAAGDDEQVRTLLDLALTELSVLAQQPEVSEQPRFRELYRTVITEYEKQYGTTDSLSIQHGDIFGTRADMFAELNEVDSPLLEDVTLPTLQPIETTVPMTMNRLVESSIKYLLRSPNKHLFNWMRRADTYFPMIEQILREEGVPDELKYLAMIESGLNPTAQSWAAAAGMWQFIQATGRAYGLEVNQWVDERKDPEKATRAAARHLRDLHQMFGGDWQLALAGYNCNPARIRRALERAERRLGRKATFWDIYEDIPRETRGYVPMFIAAALVASNPDAFNLPPVQPGPRYEYDHAPVPGMMSLRTIAEMAGTDVETIRALNPELRRQSTPPVNGGLYHLRLPIGTYEQFAAAYAAAPKEHRQRAATTEHVVRRGESLGRIADRYGVTVADLKSANGLRSNTIHTGQRLVVSVEGQSTGVPAADLSNAKAVRVQYGARSTRPILAAEIPSSPRYSGPSTPVVTVSGSEASSSSRSSRTTASSSSESQTRVVYKVRRGDSLGKIASRYGVSVSDLKRWNGLRSSTIHAGQNLKIYSDGVGQAVAASHSSSSASSERIVHKVQRGETLGKIAARYGVSVSDLRRWNDISGSTIHVGQRLSVHSKGGGSAQASSSGDRVIYKVRRGDTLTEIAAKYGVSVSDIKRWNNLKSNTIRSGQRLKIYS